MFLHFKNDPNGRYDCNETITGIFVSAFYSNTPKLTPQSILSRTLTFINALCELSTDFMQRQTYTIHFDHLCITGVTTTFIHATNSKTMFKIHINFIEVNRIWQIQKLSGPSIPFLMI